MAKKNQLTTSDYMNEAEFKNLLDLLRADKEYIWELYARVSFYTACRSSDVLKMKWSTILDKEQTVVVETKTKKARPAEELEEEIVMLRKELVKKKKKEMPSKRKARRTAEKRYAPNR